MRKRLHRASRARTHRGAGLPTRCWQAAMAGGTRSSAKVLAKAGGSPFSSAGVSRSAKVSFALSPAAPDRSMHG